MNFLREKAVFALIFLAGDWRLMLLMVVRDKYFLVRNIGMRQLLFLRFREIKNGAIARHFLFKNSNPHLRYPPLSP
jgi:hypothetical protein